MEESDSSELLFDNALKDSKFYFYCPNMADEDRILITNLIKESKGVRIYNIYYIINSKLL